MNIKLVYLYYKNIKTMFLLTKEQVLYEKSYLNQSGYINSILHNKSVNYTSEPIPWMNYPVIDFLDSRLNKNQSVFEYGSGYSTLYYCRKVKNVISVENSATWYSRVKKKSVNETNLRLILESNINNYANQINSFERSFDVIVVDSINRFQCIQYAIKNLTGNGVIILDDSDREKYIECHEFLQSYGYKSITFSGLKPMQRKSCSTSIFYKKNNCFNI